VAETIDILLVEDSDADADIIERVLVGLPIRLNRTRTMGESMSFLQSKSPDVVLLDLGLPDSNNMVDTARVMVGRLPNTPIIALTGLDEERVAIDTIKVGLQGFFVKGTFDGSSLFREIQRAIARSGAKTDTDFSGLTTALTKEVVKACQRELSPVMAAASSNHLQTQPKQSWVRRQLDQHWLALLGVLGAAFVYVSDFRDEWRQDKESAESQIQAQVKDEQQLNTHVSESDRKFKEFEERDIKLQILLIDAYDGLKEDIEDRLPRRRHEQKKESDSIKAAREQNQREQIKRGDLFKVSGSSP